MKLIAVVAVLLTMTSQAWSYSFDWTGGYRFEYTEIDRPSLADPYNRKAYGLNYLYLQPHIIAADSVSITARFDILSNQTESYKGSQLGQLWGGTVGSTTDTGYNNTTRDNQGTTTLNVSQLYMKASQEYGSFVAGRMPFHFGLGAVHNAGTGAFDHWMDTHDLVAFKFIVGSVYFIPMLGKVYQEGPGQGNSSSEQMFQIQYESQDSGTELGVLLERRNASNAAVANGQWQQAWRNYYSDATASVQSDFSFQRTIFYLSKDWSTFGFKLETGFSQSQTGIQLTSGSQVKTNGYGVATEIYYKPQSSKWETNFRAGIASGDDPQTTDYEGYQMDRNYDVAFLLFNHRLGQKDFLNTSISRDTNLGTGNSFDDESINNAYYLSPRFKYAWSDKLDLFNTFTYAQLLNVTRNSTNMKKDLGVEWDIELTYRPREKIQWVNRFGYLFAGSAFQEGSSNLGNNNTFGFETKVAISF